MKEELPENLAKNSVKSGAEKNGEEATTKDAATVATSGEGVKETGDGGAGGEEVKPPEGEEGVKEGGSEGGGDKEEGEKERVGEGGGGGKLPEALSMPSENSIQSAAASALAAAAVKAKVSSHTRTRKQTKYIIYSMYTHTCTNGRNTYVHAQTY